MAFQTSIKLPSPAVSFVGRHNSGKTTLIEGVIACLVASGLNVGSVKHHSHQGFDIDIPGKDSYRHRAAGARETVIASPGQIARIRTIEGEKECSDILDTMPGHDIVVVEGYRKSGLPTIEVMRAGNPADLRVAQVFARAAKEGAPLGVDFVQAARLKPHEIPAVQHEDVLATQFPDRDDLTNKMPTDCTVAIVSDIPEAHKAAALYHIPCFDINDVAGVCAFLRKHYVRHRITVAVQAGGESRRMGQSKATVPFAGRPLICRMVERVSPVADDFIVTTNEAENLGFLHTDYPELGIRLIPDVYDFRGALPGIYSALQAAKNPYVAIVACDMLCASPSLIAREVIAMDQSGADVVVPVNNHGYEPFHALYRRDVCMEAIKEALSQGSRRAQSFFDSVNVCELPQSEVLKAEPMGGCFINANTPEELHLMEKAFFEE
ncbi:MAG: molybdopterin-guanine dinucleotide biosynthesis protein B [Raoultibacter sp.]